MSISYNDMLKILAWFENNKIDFRINPCFSKFRLKWWLIILIINMVAVVGNLKVTTNEPENWSDIN